MGDNFKNIKGNNIIVNKSKISFGNKNEPDNNKKIDHELKDRLMKLLSANKIPILVNELKSEFVRILDKDSLNELILIEANHNALLEKRRLGLLTIVEFSVGESNIRKSLLDKLNQIQ